MLTVVEKFSFVILALVCGYYAWTAFRRVYQAVTRGKPDNRFENLASRVWTAIGIVLTQQSVFKTRPIVSAMHAMVFYGFVYYFVVNVVDVLEGFFPLQARGGWWNPFNVLADLLTTSVLLGILGLLVRRFFIEPGTFATNPSVPMEPGITAGIRRDSLIVGLFILFHVGSRLLSKAAQLAHAGGDPFQPVASTIALLFSIFRNHGTKRIVPGMRYVRAASSWATYPPSCRLRDS